MARLPERLILGKHFPTFPNLEDTNSIDKTRIIQ